MGQVLGENMGNKYSLNLASCTLACQQKLDCHYSVFSNRNCYFYSSGCGCTEDTTVLGVVSAPGSSLNTKATCAKPHQAVGHYVAMGGPGAKCGLTANCGTRVEQDTVLMNVRCCSDGPGAVGHWWKKSGCGNVFGGSKVDDAYTCKSGLTWAQANNWCTTNGARLCTKEEILNGCAKGTGCSFDFGPVWTSGIGTVPVISLPPTTTTPTTQAPTAHGTPTFYRLVQRNPDFRCTEATGCQKRWMHALQKYPITCCRDKVGIDVGKYEVWYMKNWQDPVCKDVYTESDIWSMHHDIRNRCIVGTWYDGERICREAGGRLCTTEEIEHKCAISTGCGFDGRLMWTSEGQ